MKGLSKPISSPGRTEKFPPPLMRFLRSNVGSRSRGRTRASPMFMRNNNNNKKNNVSIETTQEPSSPKVTCIGQVRVRRPSKSTGNRRTRRSSSIRKQQKHQKQQERQKGPCCCNFRVKLQRPKSLISVVRKWVGCFRFGYCGGRRRRVETVDSSSRVESTQRVQSRVSTTSSDSIENAAATATVKTEPFVTDNEDGFMSSNSNTPPKNALILTRCRSAPYRSSSLAGRFWGSPLNHSSSETENQIPQINVQQNPVLENPISSPKDDENGDLVSRKSHGSEQEEEETQSSINGGSSSREEEQKNGGGDHVHPLLLTRCKSEPARTGERLINPTRFTEPDPQS
ncbi:hypothetical protein HAX54_049395 [Datura stramonium]|uniref:Uncharacterized protein n=1 Tax=Datura stramonium TaxID=4076 RepID=A0ABS8SWR4_DATST|nr:hypothetical protein [Datura stramonium]